MPNMTVTRCELCSTEVRPNKAYCDRCKARRIDSLLDTRLQVTYDNILVEMVDRQLIAVRANVRGEALVGAK